MDHSSGDEDYDRRRRGEGSHAKHNYHFQLSRHNSKDCDTRSHSSHKSDPNSETSGKGEAIHSNLSTTGSVGSYGSGGENNGTASSRGFPLHSHVHFRHAIGAAHLLNGDPSHQFPPSLYPSSADAPKSDTATVCSGSILEDIEDVGSHYDGESTMSGQGSTASTKVQHSYPAPPGTLKRSNSHEGNRLVDFAERSQEGLPAVFPKQSKLAGQNSSNPSALSQSVDDDAGLSHKKGMGPPLTRHWLLQQQGALPFPTGSSKSVGSNTGSDVIVNVGSDCGGSLTDGQSVLSQEDASMLTALNPETSTEVQQSMKSSLMDTSTAAATQGPTAAASTDDERKPHPLLCDQSDGKTSGRISPGGTIYRGRGIRRYKGRFYALPLKRFHQDGVHLHSDSEAESSMYQLPHSQSTQNQQQHRYSGEFKAEDPTGHNYFDRERSRSRSRSPVEDPRRKPPRDRAPPNIDHKSPGYELRKTDPRDPR